MRNDLGMEGYVRLGTRRRAFDNWLRANDLDKQLIFYMRVGEGYIDAKCYLEPRRVSVDQEGPAWEWRRFVVSVPPDPHWFDGN